MTTTNFSFNKPDATIKKVEMTIVNTLNDGSKIQYYLPNIEIDIEREEPFLEQDFFKSILDKIYVPSNTLTFKGRAYQDGDASCLTATKIPKSEEKIKLELPIFKADLGGISFPKPPENPIGLKANGGWCAPSEIVYDLYNTEKETKMPEIYTELTTRSTAFPKNGGNPIAASVPGYSRIPFKYGTTTLIGIDGVVIYAKTLDEKRDLAFTHDHILVCWPGVYSQDIFYIDDIDALKKALGLLPKKEKTRKDRKGNEWVVA